MFGSILADVTQELHYNEPFPLFRSPFPVSSLVVRYPLLPHSEWEIRGDALPLIIWKSITLGNFTIPQTQTVYLRKHLQWSQLSVAFRLCLHYRFGVIAYINGMEILRDNLPAGPINSTTLATGSYNQYADHQFVRSVELIGRGSVLLEVELHWPKLSNKSKRILFDAWLEELGNGPSSDCFVIPFPATSNLTDFNKLSYTQFEGPSTSFLLNFYQSYTVNMISLYAPQSTRLLPQVFQVKSGNSGTSLFGERNPLWTPRRWHTLFTGLSKSTNSLRVEISSEYATMELYEMRVGICFDATYPDFRYVVPERKLQFGGYVSLKPTSTIFSQCRVFGLPESMGFVSETCHLLGSYTGNTTLVTITVISTQPVERTTLIHLRYEQCVDTLLKVERSYCMGDAFFEWFRLRNANSGSLLLAVEPGTTQKAGSVVSFLVCTSATRLELTMGSERRKFWLTGSSIKFSFITNKKTIFLYQTRYDERFGFSQTRMLSLTMPIPFASLWRYHFDSIPENWFLPEFDDSFWPQATANTFPPPSRNTWFFRRSFLVRSFAEYAAVKLYIRYDSCFAIYINGNVVHSFQVSLPVTNTTVCYSHNTPAYHSFSFPKSILQSGTNSIAIAFVSFSPTSVVSFDCMVQLLLPQMDSLMMGGVASSDSVVNPSTIISMNLNSDLFAYGRGSNDILLSFGNSRCESFNVIQLFRKTNGYSPPLHFELYGRSDSQNDWSLIYVSKSIVWFPTNNVKSFFVNLPICYTELLLSKISGDAEQTASWELLEVSFLLLPIKYFLSLGYTDNVIPTGDSMTLLPTSPYYSNFKAVSLPSEFQIDSASGAILGSYSKTREEVIAVTAQHLNGTAVSLKHTLTFQECSSVPVTIHVLLLSVPHFLYIWVYDSAQVAAFQLYQLFDQPGEYTFQTCLRSERYALLLTSDTLWTADDRIWVTVGDSSIVVAEDRIVSRRSLSLTLDFSILLAPISSWKYLITNNPPPDWTSDLFGDFAWREAKLSDVTYSEGTTFLFRSFIWVPESPRSLLLHGQVRFQGIVIIYIAGVHVAQFGPDSDSTEQPASAYVRTRFFSVNIVQAELSFGSHVVSVEYHTKNSVTGTSAPLSFQMIVNREDLALYRDSFVCRVIQEGVSVEQVWGSPWYPRVINEMGSTAASVRASVIHLSMRPDSYLELQTSSGLSIYPNGLLITVGVESVTGILVAWSERQRKWECIGPFVPGDKETLFPQLLLGYSAFRIYLESSGNDLIPIVSLYFVFTGNAGTRCSQLEDFPGAWDGEISVIPCEEGYSGYQFRICSKGSFGTIVTTSCQLDEPSSLTYPISALFLYKGVTAVFLYPGVNGIIESYSIAPPLPSGLTLNNETGVIQGIAREKLDLTVFTVEASNRHGVTSFVFNMTVRAVMCLADDDWQSSEARTLPYRLLCPHPEATLGVRWRYCSIVDQRGIWRKEGQLCIPKSGVAGFLVVSSLFFSIGFYFLLHWIQKKSGVC